MMLHIYIYAKDSEGNEKSKTITIGYTDRCSIDGYVLITSNPICYGYWRPYTVSINGN